MAKIIKTRIQLRRGKASAFANNNPLLLSAEPAYELDTGKLKLGDGVSNYNDLPYFQAEVSKDSLITKEQIQQLFQEG